MKKKMKTLMLMLMLTDCENEKAKETNKEMITYKGRKRKD